MMSIFSIIIPIYNCEAYLRECVTSFFLQTFDNQYEIISVDDGSLDSSGSIADELSKQYEYVRSYHKANGGAASARNYGIRKAAGDYILFIDGDDTVVKIHI